MADEPILAQLKDIRLPETVGSWPMAYGWYLLMILSLMILAFLMYILYRSFKRAQIKRQALSLLKAYETQHQQDKNSAFMCARVSELLKRVALVYFPREQVAALSGEKWVQFLNQTGKQLDFDSVYEELIEMPYRDQSGFHDLSKLFKLSRQWISQRKRPCLN